MRLPGQKEYGRLASAANKAGGARSPTLPTRGTLSTQPRKRVAARKAKDGGGASARNELAAARKTRQPQPQQPQQQQPQQQPPPQQPALGSGG